MKKAIYLLLTFCVGTIELSSGQKMSKKRNESTRTIQALEEELHELEKQCKFCNSYNELYQTSTIEESTKQEMEPILNKIETIEAQINYLKSNQS